MVLRLDRMEVYFLFTFFVKCVLSPQINDNLILLLFGDAIEQNFSRVSLILKKILVQRLFKMIQFKVEFS
jgi:hypothetical protein